MALSYIKKKQSKSNSHWKSLSRADGTMPLPLTLELEDCREPLLLEEVIRLMPGKRLVAFGHYGEQEVAIKCFFEKRRAKLNFQRDLFGIEALMQANVPTPKLLYQGTAEKRRIYILVYEKIAPAYSLEKYWEEQKYSEEIKPLLQRVTIEIATQHVLGILQQDLHFKNFLITEKAVITLDGGKISKFDNPLNKKTSLAYLSLFLAQLGVGHNTLQQGLFELYTHSRGWIIKKADIQFFQKCMEQRNRERYNRYQKKIFRNCSAFKKVRHFTKSIMYDRQFEAKEFVELLQNPEKIFSARTTIFLKKGRSSTVAKIQVDNRTLVIKRYNIKNVWHALRRALRETRAVKSWRDAHHIFAAGIRTPKPIAFIENQCLGFRGKSYFIMEYVAGNDVGDYFDSHREDQKMIEQMANRLLELFNQLATLSLTHGDLKKTNILVDKTWPVLIDMDAIAEHYSKWGLKSAFSNEIKRFMRNWEKEPALCNLFHNLLENHGQTSAINAR